jgi:hypothetical protein
MSEELMGKYLVAAFMLISEFALAWYFYQRYLRIKKLSSIDATLSTGQIEKLTNYRSKNATIYRAHYNFKTWQGDDIKGQQTMPKAEWETLREGQSASVAYLRTHPKVNALRDHVAHHIKSSKLLCLAFAAMPLVMIPALIVILWVDTPH